MPTKPGRPCCYYRCPTITSDPSGYCETHKKLVRKQYDDERGNSNERGYTYHWQKIRRLVLSEEPLCRECSKQGLVVPATDVHHIDGNVQNMSTENLEPLCHECHSRITAKTQGYNRG